MFPSSAFVLEIDLSNTCRQATSLPAEACRVLRLFDGHRGLQEVLDDSPLEVPKTLAVVQRLAGEGLIRLAAKNKAVCSGGAGSRQALAEEVKRWLGMPVTAMSYADAADESGLEAALDEVLSGPDPGPEDNLACAMPVESIPDSIESALERTLKECSRLEDLLEAHAHDLLDLEVDDVLLPASDPDLDYSGFSPMEEEFFESYVPEEPDGSLQELLEEIRTH